MKKLLYGFAHSEYREKAGQHPERTYAGKIKRANGAEDQRRILSERSELCSRPERSELIQLKCPSKRAQGAARFGRITAEQSFFLDRKSSMCTLLRTQ